MWLRLLLTELGIVTKFILIKADNQGSIALAKNPEFHNRTKHVGIQYYYYRQEIEAGRIRVEFVGIEDMLADALTKPLQLIKFKSFQGLLGLQKS